MTAGGGGDCPPCASAKPERPEAKKSPFGVIWSSEAEFGGPEYSVYDAGEMPKACMITCVAEFGDGDGSVVMFGGNNTDSYWAGYLITKVGSQIWFCVQMNANESDGPIMTEDGDWNGEHDIVAQYDGTHASLYIDGNLVAEGDRNWVPAEGGIVSMMTGSHNGGESAKDEGPGCVKVYDVNICRNGGKRFCRLKKIIAKFDDYVDTPMKACADAGSMSDGVIMSCYAYCESGVGGSLLHYGGNNEDSWLAGYILYYDGADLFLWGIQMNANGSDGPIQATGFAPDEYTICGTYKDGHAQLWIDDELAGEQDCTWNTAEGGLLTLCSGTHKEGEEKDEAGAGNIGISDVFIATM
jgi:hypothetical protein